MGLLPEDEDLLREKWGRWELLGQAGPEQFLVLRAVKLAPGRFDQPEVDVLVKIPPGYPLAPIDMFWVSPQVRLANGTLPPAADHHETHEGRQWQRFSRHLKGWRPGVDSLASFLGIALQELIDP